MYTHKTFLALIFSIASLLVFSQTIVKDISELASVPEAQFFQDVDGKVLISAEYQKSLEGTFISKAFEIYAGWPIAQNGNSTRGGIYCNLDEDPELEIVYCISLQVYAWNIDGSLVPGWPVSTQLYPDGAPAFGDIDGDGIGEVVVSTRQAGTGNTGRLMAYHSNGSSVTGFPVILTGGATKTVVLADLNGDNVLEIIVEERAYPDGYVGVYKGDGSSFPGFPVALDYIPASAVAVGDITGDNIPEIIAESYYSIYAFDVNGNVLEGFPFTPGSDRVFSYSSPVLADIDGDGFRDIIVGDHSLSAGTGAVHIINHFGNPITGWPKYANNWIYGPPAVGDINGDGLLDVTVGDQVLAGSPSDRVYAWDHTGTLLPGWPTNPINAINNQIILADIDDDNAVELIWDDNTNVGVYLGYNHDGTPMAGWPLPVLGSTFFMNPFVADLNNDGNYDMSGGGINISTYDLNFYLWNTNVPVKPLHSPLTILQYNVRHDGVYIDASALSAGFYASPTYICQSNQTFFTDESTGEVSSWSWIFEGGMPATSIEQNPVVFYENPGVFDVSLEISDGSTTNTMVKSDYIHVAMESAIPLQPIGPYNFNTDTANLTYYETTSANADEYIWELDPANVGVIVAGDSVNNIKIYWSSASNYSAQLKVKSVNVCGESDFSEPLTIYVNWISEIHSNQSSKPYYIYPNPNNGVFTIESKSETNFKNIILINGFGIQVKSIPMVSHSKIKFDGILPGVYYLQFEISGKRYIEKILVK